MSEDKSRLSVSIRLSPDLRDELAEAARRNSHSMNAEIVDRLEQPGNTIPGAGGHDPLQMMERIFSAFFDGPTSPEDFRVALRHLLKVEEAALGVAETLKDQEAGTDHAGHLWAVWMSRFFVVERIKKRIQELEA